MGHEFSLQLANTLGWLTWPGPGQPPPGPIEVEELRKVLRLRDKKAFIEWPESEISELARLAEREQNDAQFLLNAREAFRHFVFYGLAISIDDEEFWSFSRDAGHSGLIMRPDEPVTDLDLSTPFPPLRHIAEMPSSSLVLWSASGTSAAVPAEYARKTVRELAERSGSLAEHRRHRRFPYTEYFLRFTEGVKQVDRYLQRLRDRQRATTRCILHLSDLHFGGGYATGRQSNLLQSVLKLVDTHDVKRVVITGDLIDQPRKKYLAAADAFRSTLETVVGTEPLVVPGNHDRKAYGTFQRWFKKPLPFHWKPFENDDDMRIVFCAFDSTLDAVGAQGRVTEQQRMDRATELALRSRSKPETAGYLRVGLVHHHPFSFKTPAEGVWRLFKRFGLDEETFLRMEEGEGLVDWCGHLGVSLLLHGHKHVPYAAHKEVKTPRGYTLVRSVGCGSSVGEGGLPMSVNVHRWIEAERCWTTEYLLQVGDGRGFTNHNMSIRQIR